MGKPTGFMEYDRKDNKAVEPLERIKNFNEFHTPMSEKDRATQAARCMNCGVPFCQSGILIKGMVTGCPLNNLIPEWNDATYTGNWDEAYNRLRKTNPFPEFTGRVCPHPCEVGCTCNLGGDPVNIKEKELSIIERAYESGLIKPEPPEVRTGKTVAIVGSGPSGLCVAEYLNRRGHSVTVYERSDRVGGLLMYGIPNMKLEKTYIERKVKLMEKEGVVFKTGVNVGVDVKAQDLKKQYDAVVLCCGASNPRDIKAPGRKSKGIYFAVDYLKAATKSLLDSNFADKKYIDAKDKNVMVIGGGDTGNDCVGTSIRLGCKSLIQLEMMPKLPDERQPNNPWPEWPRVCKTDYGQEEAIAVFGKDPRVYQTTVKEFILNKDTGEVSELKPHTVTVTIQNGKEMSSTIVSEEDFILPVYKGELEKGYQFDGWEISGVKGKKDAGYVIIVSKDTLIKPVFKKIEEKKEEENKPTFDVSKKKDNVQENHSHLDENYKKEDLQRENHSHKSDSTKDVTAKVPDENDKNFENKKEVYLNEPENIDNKHTNIDSKSTTNNDRLPKTGTVSEVFMSLVAGIMFTLGAFLGLKKKDQD